MTTSGSVDFNPTRDDVIKSALRLCGVIDAEETPTGAEINDTAQALNFMLKSWATKGIGLWAEQECTLFLEPSQILYRLGTASGADHCTASHVETTTATDEAISATVIGVTSSSGMTAGDFIGIVLDSGVTHWTTIVSVDSSTQVTITSGLASAAASGAVVYAYTSKIGRPSKIIEARHRGASTSEAGDGTDLPLEPLARADYMNLSVKSTSGTPTQFFYSPQLSLGVLNIWPGASASGETIRMTIKRTIEDMDATSDTFDFPQEWLQAIRYNLAAEICMEFKVPFQRMQMIIAKAMLLLEEAMGFDNEGASFSFYPASH